MALISKKKAGAADRYLPRMMKRNYHKGARRRKKLAQAANHHRLEIADMAILTLKIPA
jgi:hypothetical protein